MSATEVRVTTEQESRQVAEQARQKEWEGRAFLRELFLGQLALDLVHPFPTAPERPEFAKFYRDMERFLREEVDSVAIDATGEYPDHVVEGLPEGPAVVLSNSLGSSRAMWDPQMPGLSRRFRVIRYDHRGHGALVRARGHRCAARRRRQNVPDRHA